MTAVKLKIECKSIRVAIQGTGSRSEVTEIKAHLQSNAIDLWQGVQSDGRTDRRKSDL